MVRGPNFSIFVIPKNAIIRITNFIGGKEIL